MQTISQSELKVYFEALIALIASTFILFFLSSIFFAAACLFVGVRISIQHGIKIIIYAKRSRFLNQNILLCNLSSVCIRLSFTKEKRMLNIEWIVQLGK